MTSHDVNKTGGEKSFRGLPTNWRRSWGMIEALAVTAGAEHIIRRSPRQAQRAFQIVEGPGSRPQTQRRALENREYGLFNSLKCPNWEIRDKMSAMAQRKMPSRSLFSSVSIHGTDGIQFG
jgi:hypothetical protein